MKLSFFAALTFYLFPLLIGRALVKPLVKRDLNYSFISYFVTGEILIFGLVLFLNYTLRAVFPQIPFAGLLAAVFIASVGVALPVNFLLGKKDLQIKRHLLPLALSFLFAIFAYALWQHNSPYPLNWDIYEHQTLINEMLKGRFSFVTSAITDTFGFNSYSSATYVDMAVSQLFFKMPIFDYWNAISIIHFTLIILGSYLFTKEVTSNKAIAFLSMPLAAFIFDSNMSLTTLFFIPQTYVSMVFMFLFIQLISEVKEKRVPRLWLVAVGIIFLVLNHYVIGGVAAAIYLGTYLYYRNHKLITSHVNKLVAVEASLFIGYLTIIFSSNVSFLNSINVGEAQMFTFNLAEKINIMRQIYGFLFILFLPIGVMAALNRKKEIEVTQLVVMLGLLTIVLLQLPYVLKFYTLARMFTHLFIAIGIYALIKQINNRALRIVSYYLLFAALIITFICNATIWKESLENDGNYTQISPLEIQAADFLKAKYSNSNVLLISDPATQYVLETFSQVNTQGGAYMDLKTREILNSVNQTSNTGEVAKELYKVNDALNPTNGKRIFVLSGRYFIWQRSDLAHKYSLGYNVWHPADLTFDNEKVIEQFEADKAHFKLIYENPAMVILEVNDGKSESKTAINKSQTKSLLGGILSKYVTR